MTFIPGPALIFAWAILTAGAALYLSACLPERGFMAWLRRAAAIWLLIQAAALAVILGA